jgi:Ulp1 family protease
MAILNPVRLSPLQVASAWSFGDGDSNVVCSLASGAGGSSVDILGKHFGRLRNAWLFDESVNAYMFLLQERDKRHVAATGAKPSHFMSSFFFEKVRRARVVVNHWNHAIHKSHFMNFFFSEKVSVQERAF